MAVMTIRNLDDEVREKLRIRAAHNGRSMEAEVRAILAAAAHVVAMTPEALIGHSRPLVGPAQPASTGSEIAAGAGGGLRPESRRDET